MKKSEEYKLKSAEEDSELKSFALLCKALREKRSEKFIEDWLPLLSQRYEIKERGNGSYSIKTQEYDVIDYFPKANKLLIRRSNLWIKPGLKMDNKKFN